MGMMLGAAGATAVGCAATPTTSTGASATPTPTEDTRARAPLTGELVTDTAALNHAAVALKISDVKTAHPQAGLNQADIVFVEPNGLAYTRLCAVFHSQLPALAGPVRSIRPVDVGLLSPMKPVFGNTSAAIWVMNYVAANSEYIENLYALKVHGTGSYEVTRKGDDGEFCHPKVLLKQAKVMKSPPAEQYLPFATGTDAASTDASSQAALKISVPWGTGNSFSTGYTYDSKTKQYLRSEPWGKHVLIDGKRVTTDNVLVVRAKWKMDKIFAGGGAKDPVVSIVNGKGTFYYCHQGKYVTGTWTKGAVNELFQFTLADGSPLKVAPGRTFFEIPQIDAKVKITG
jgi:hypothetical protein